jgi:hypothetical protein
MYINCSPAPWENISTKKGLKDAIASKGAKVEFRDTNGRTLTIGEVPPGTILSVTNHPKRSWFANVTMKGDTVKVT